MWLVPLWSGLRLGGPGRASFGWGGAWMGARSWAGAGCGAVLVPGRPPGASGTAGEDAGAAMGRGDRAVGMCPLRTVRVIPPPEPPAAALLRLCWSSSEGKRFVFSSRSTSSVEKWYGGVHHQLGRCEGVPLQETVKRTYETYVRAFDSIAEGAGAAQRGLIFLRSAPGYRGFLFSSSFVLFSDHRPALLPLYQVVN